MSAISFSEQEFVKQLTEIIEANLHNEQFGVSELARKMGMSRVSLHRKIKSATNTSASQFICQIRLKKALELLKQNTATVSETAYDCGFHSVSYFSKCFHDFYGYPPGEVGKQNESETIPIDKSNKKRLVVIVSSAFFIILIFVVFFVLEKPFSFQQKELEKTIAVLPFEDYSGDEGNVNIADGLLTDIINNLYSIKNLKVVTRSTVDNYENSKKSNPLIAKELMVNYLLYGSVHKLGKKIEINVELIEASSDTSVWRESYLRNIDETNIEKLFEIQEDVAFKVASALNVKLTEKEKVQIAKKPTENPAAYNKYQEGMNHKNLAELNIGSNYLEEVFKAKRLFEQAIKLDSTYSEAYIMLGHTYMDNIANNTADIYLADRYLDSALIMFDKFMLFDPNNADQVLFWKRNCLLRKGSFEKADEITKNLPQNYIKNYGYYQGNFSYYHLYDDCYNIIKCFYKYQELKPEDKLTPQYMLHYVWRIFVYMGYPNLAKKYAGKLFNQTNDSIYILGPLFSINWLIGNYKAAQINFERIDTTKNMSTWLYWQATYNCVMLRDYNKANLFLLQLEKFSDDAGSTINPDFIYGFVYLKNGLIDKAKFHFDQAIKKHTDEIKLKNQNAQKYYSHAYLASIYSELGENEKALEYLKELKNRKSNPLWLVNFLKDFPLFDNIRNESEFQEILADVDAKYQKEHLRVGELLRDFGEIE